MWKLLIPPRARAACGEKAVATALIVSMLSMIALSPVAAQSGEEMIYERFEEASALRSQGKYGAAVEILRGIIAEFAKSDEILRRAYSDLVFTLLSMQDESGAGESARQALSRYPDLTADPVFFPPRVNELYDNLRNQMYGSLNVVSKPESCRVFLGETFMGAAPLSVKYVLVGDYTLNLSKSGYKDEASPVRIEPGSPTSVQLALQKERGKKWWLTRVAPGVILAGALAYFGLKGDEGTPAPEPLAGPPPPPTE